MRVIYCISSYGKTCHDFKMGYVIPHTLKPLIKNAILGRTSCSDGTRINQQMNIYMKHIVFLLFLCLSTVLLGTAYPEPAAAEKLDPQKELAYRVRFGGPSDVEYLIGKGADPNGVNEYGVPLVSVAAARTDGQAVPILERLVEGGADLNQGGPSRQYPIILAARNGDIELTEYLLDEAVDTNVHDKNGITPAEIARYNGHDEVAALLAELEIKHAEALEKMTSPERYRELMHALAFEYCATQYTHYYFKSGQDTFSEDYMQSKKDIHLGKISTISNDLYQIFQVKLEDMYKIRDYAFKKIYDQMEELISNRNRRKHGIGKPEDLEKRCTTIADEWMEMQDAAEAKRKNIEAKRKNQQILNQY